MEQSANEQNLRSVVERIERTVLCICRLLYWLESLNCDLAVEEPFWRSTWVLIVLPRIVHRRWKRPA